MKVKLATKRIGALALSLLIGLGSCVTTNIQKAYATDELESQASDSVSSATTSGGDAVTLADALGDEGEDTGIAPLGLGDQYTVTFNLNGGTLDPINNTTDNQQVTVEEGQTVQNPGYPVKYEGDSAGDYNFVYKLDKWTLDGEEYDFSTPITHDIELTATYTEMNVTYDGNGGLLTNPAGAFGPFTDQTSVNKKVNSGTPGLLFFTRGTKEGFEFDGWNDKADGTGTAETPYGSDVSSLGKYLSDINYTSVGGDITFYAKWVAEADDYTLNYVVKGHDNCNSCARIGIAYNNTKNVGADDVISQPTDYEDNIKDYASIEGWYTTEDFQPATKVEFTESIRDLADNNKTVTLYGKVEFKSTEVWINQNLSRRVTGQKNWEAPNYKIGDLLAGHTLAESGITLPTTLTREGSEFQGWTIKKLFSNKDYKELYSNDSYNIDEAISVYPWMYEENVIDPSVTPDVMETRSNMQGERKTYVYQRLVYIACWNYKIQIDYNNGVDPVENYVVNFNESTPKLIYPTREGYRFLGWVVKDTDPAAGPHEDGERGDSWAIAEDVPTLRFSDWNDWVNDILKWYTGEERERLEKIYGDGSTYVRIMTLIDVTPVDSGVTVLKAVWEKEGDDHQHTWNTNWSSDDNNHWHDAACGHDIKKDQAPHTPSDWIVDKQPTSSSEGLKHKECTVCHKVLETGKIAKIEIIIQPEATPTPSATPVPSATPTSELKHEHEFSKEWTTNESSHWHDATCGHDVRDGEAPHTPSDWIVAKQPTETEEGYRYKECTVCYDVLDTEIIDRLSSMVIEVPEEPDPQPVVEETVTEEPVETPAPVVTPAPTTKEDKVIVAPVFDNGDQDAENIQGAMGRFLEGVKTVAVVLSISLAAVLGILGLLLLILAAMRRVKVQNDRSGDYEESNFVTVYKTSVSTEGSRIAQLFRKNDRVWNVVIPEEVVADRVTDFFKVVLTKSFCKRYNGEQLIVIMDSEDDQVKKQFGFVIDGEDNEISITIKE